MAQQEPEEAEEKQKVHYRSSHREHNSIYEHLVLHASCRTAASASQPEQQQRESVSELVVQPPSDRKRSESDLDEQVRTHLSAALIEHRAELAAR